MNEFLEIVLRGVIAVVYLFLITKALGAKQISQLNFYDYIVGITIGSIAATLCVDPKLNILYSLVAMSIFAGSDLIMSLLSRKTIWGRRILNGRPLVLVDNGKILYDGLKKSQLNISDLLRELRIKDYFNIADVGYIIYGNQRQIKHSSQGPQKTRCGGRCGCCKVHAQYIRQCDY